MPKKFETVIGLEVHVELSTRTKIFCGCSTAFKAAPNSQVCPVCMGMPGTLPVLNRRVVEYACKTGLALNCEITRRNAFDRKNYFYPDNPQNYQISQLYQPICRNGYLDGVTEDQESFRVRIHEIHMEEDAGKLIHDENGNSLVDYNRAGVPLIEIVTAPDMRNEKQVLAFLEKLRTTISYLGVSDCRMEQGSMRVDLNLSVREEGEEKPGVRTEMKNLNSFHCVAAAIAAERERQIALIKEGGEVLQETRRFDEGRNQSFAMRSKESARDYRYFPDPDLVPVIVDEDWLKRLKDELPEFREERRKRMLETYRIPEYDVELLTTSRQLADLFEATVACGAPPKKVSNWLMVETLRILKERGLYEEDICFSPGHLAALIELAEKKVINSTVAKQVFEELFERDIDPVYYVRENGLEMINEAGDLRKLLLQVLSENPKSVEDYRNGKERALGYLVGCAMKATAGKANPLSVRELLIDLLADAASANPFEINSSDNQ